MFFMFCRWLFVLLYLLFWPFCCLFFDIQILLTLWYLQTFLIVQKSKCDRNDFRYYETLPLYSLSSFHCIVYHRSTVLSVILPLYYLSSFHMWLSITFLVCSRISQKSAQLWQNNIKHWSSSTQLISTTRVSPSLNSLNTKKTTTYHVENPGSSLEQALNVAGIHQLMGILGSKPSHRENVSHYCPKIIQN
jgi:hypothetical protein